MHQHLHCIEIDIDADTLATCWLSTWWIWTNTYILSAWDWCIPDIEVIWYSIESQFRTASVTIAVIVVVQYDGSQGDSCGEYEQQLPITTTSPHIIVCSPILLLSKVGISQFELCIITMDIIFWTVTCLKVTRWIALTVGTDTLSSVDRVMTIGILWWVQLVWSGGYCGVVSQGNNIR